MMQTDAEPPPDAPQPPDGTPEIEDAYAVPEAPSEECLIEDDAELLDTATRALEADTEHADELDEATAAEAAARSAQAAQKDDTSDADSIPDEPTARMEEQEQQELPNWDQETSTHRIAVELKHIENEIRRLLDGRDPKRKRKLGGTRRWIELEEDILAWRYTGRIDEPTLRQLCELIAQRHRLFRRLSFLAGTRPVWNT